MAGTRRVRCVVEYDVPESETTEEALARRMSYGHGSPRLVEHLELTGELAEPASSPSNDLTSFLLARWPHFSQDIRQNAASCILLADTLGSLLTFVRLHAPPDDAEQIVSAMVERVRAASLVRTEAIVQDREPGTRH